METEVHRIIHVDLEADGPFSGDANAEMEGNESLGLDVNDLLAKLDSFVVTEVSRKNEVYDSRKSLAWDDAFFTSSGVLDPEELSSMITGADKADREFLHGIEEEITGSIESISTSCWDNWSLESFEDDLFGDIRASIQRSSRKASESRNSCTTTEEIDNGEISSLQKENLSSQNKNPKLVLQKTSGQPIVRTSKCEPKQTSAKPGVKKSFKQHSVHSQIKSSDKIGGSNSVPSRATSRHVSTPATIKNKPLTATVSSKGTPRTKASVLSGANRAFAKSAVSSETSSWVSSTTSISRSSSISSSCDSSSSISPETPVKYPSVTARRNLVKSSKVRNEPSGSFPKTPSRTTLRSRSSSSVCSSVSPASSISDLSSTASSFASSNQRSNKSWTSLETMSCTSVDHDSVTSYQKSHSTDPSINGYKNQAIALPGTDSKRFSTQNRTIQALVKKTSGLRPPSPRFGFFDGVKSLAWTPNEPRYPRSCSNNGPKSRTKQAADGGRGHIVNKN